MQDGYDFSNRFLGECKIASPVKAGKPGLDDGLADYVTAKDRIRYCLEADSDDSSSMQLAGPRERIYFNPKQVHAAICTCGGICPGLNNVIRSVVRCLWYGYGVRRITGIRFGYRGLMPESQEAFIDLDPDIVDDIQEKGGTILASARGAGERTAEIVDTLERNNINILFCVGGDGTLRGADAIGSEIERRGLKISVIGVPKTIDNDLAFIQKSFGFDTAVSEAVPVVRCAHTEAKNAINGIGLVKVMGRSSGFIAAYTTLAQSDVNFCLIPENPFDLYGEKGLLECLKRRILKRGHAVVLVAEGAGQELLPQSGIKDASGNTLFSDIGVFLRDEIKKYFKKENIEVNIKYIDPSYIIRSTPADSYDSIYCARLGSYAVHAAMAGVTRSLVAKVNDRFVEIPIEAAVSYRNTVNLESALWRDVLENTMQPASMKN